MVVAFSVIGFLVLTLIYFAMRNQSMQAELNQLRHQVKSLDKQSRFSLSALLMLSGELQLSFKTRLDEMQKHSLLSTDDYNVASFIIGQIENVIMQCCEKSATVEEALTRGLDSSNYEMDQLNKFIAKQSSEIRVPWCKNTLGGFIAACHNLTSLKSKTSSSQEATSDAPAN